MPALAQRSSACARPPRPAGTSELARPLEARGRLEAQRPCERDAGAPGGVEHRGAERKRLAGPRGRSAGAHEARGRARRTSIAGESASKARTPSPSPSTAIQKREPRSA